MGQVLGVNHIGVSVRDLDAARGFWGALGFGPHLEFAWPVGTAPADEALGLVGSAAEVVVLRAPRSYLELFAFSAPEPAERPASAPGITGVTVSVPDLDAAVDALASLGHEVVRDAGTALTRCPDGTPVHLSPGPHAGLAEVRVRVADPGSTPLAGLATDAVLLRAESGGVGAVRAPCDLGANHVCLDVVGIAAVRADLDAGTRWHHEITASSGGIASVCYGTTHDGLVVELLESHSPDASLSRTRLTTG
jgi:catechol 2,3-dioxygenase-like lactoylglutathione lyase family enzyme